MDEQSKDLAELAAFSTGTEIGIVGVVQFEGRFAERYLDDLNGPDGIKAMAKILRRESATFTNMNAIILTAKQADWAVAPGGETEIDIKAAEFIQTCLHDMSMSWNDTLRFILSMLPFGFADTEIVFKRRMGITAQPASKYDDQLIGIRKLAPRRQETISKWIFDENGGPKAMIQIDPATGDERPPIPIEKLIHFRSGDDRGGWEGLGFLEPAYKFEHTINNLEVIAGIAFQRSFTGLPTFAYKQQPTPELRAAVNRLGKRLAVNAQQFVTYPETLVDFRLETVDISNVEAIRRYIEGLRWEMQMLSLASFLRLGANNIGTQALSVTLLNLFKSSVNAALDTVADTLNKYLLPRLLAVNGTEFSGITGMPKITHGVITEVPPAVINQLQTIFDLLASPTVSHQDRIWIRNAIGLPPENEEVVTVGQTGAQQKSKPVSQKTKPQKEKSSQEQPGEVGNPPGSNEEPIEAADILDIIEALGAEIQNRNNVDHAQKNG